MNAIPPPASGRLWRPYTMDRVRASEARALFTVVSTFAGAGGSSTGYRLAGGRVLAVNEFIQEARDTYRANYPTTPILPDDIRDVKVPELLKTAGIKKGELDVLDGSPPCASFSNIGQREEGWGKEKLYSGRMQKTDDLFFEFARILEGVQPRMFVAENVKGLTTGKPAAMLGDGQPDLFGESKNTIVGTLEACGYHVRYKVLNAKEYGVPQSRARLFIVGVRNDIDKEVTFPKPFDYRVTFADIVPGFEAVYTMNGFGSGTANKIGPDDPCCTVLTIGLGAQNTYRVWRTGQDPRFVPQVDRDKYLYEMDWKDVPYIEDDSWKEDRRFSIPELKRICGFPVDFELTGPRSKQWERCGRAVPPLMMKALASHLYKEVLS